MIMSGFYVIIHYLNALDTEGTEGTRGIEGMQIRDPGWALLWPKSPRVPSRQPAVQFVRIAVVYTVIYSEIK